MPFVPLNFKPGINRETPGYAAKGFWRDCDKVRFRGGFPEKIGGWVKYSTSQFLGVCRSLFNWIALDAANYMALGTNVKYYIEQGGVFNDITPIRRTQVLGANPFASTNGSAVLVVTDNTHGAVDGDYVTFTGAAGFANFAAGDLNKEFVISIIDTNSYRITTAVTANATTTGGGAGVTAAYQINVGQSVATSGDGWGSSTWGRSTWGSGSTVFVPTAQLRLWSQTAYGEDLVFAPRNGAVYYWDKTTGLAARAVLLSSLGGASDVPTIVLSVLFTEQRYLVAFGSNPIGSATQDPLFIRWATQESVTNWTPGATNSAGGTRLSSGSYIVANLKMRQETLVWTDSDLYSMQYTGSPYYFTFDFLARNISIAGPNAMAAVGEAAFWMGQDKFYVYNGRVQTLRCDVWKKIFGDLNREQLFQVYCGTNEGFNEVLWLYCSLNATIIDRYVIYNHAQDIWYYGTITRTAWIDSPLRSQPQATSTDSYLYYHEVGVDDGSVTPVAAISSYIESADSEIGNGDAVMFVRRIIPDVTFDGSTATSPSVTMTLKMRTTPGSAYHDTGTAGTTRSATSPVEQYTDEVWLRLRGRQAMFRIESTATGVQWQLGTPRVEAQADGRRR